MTRVGIASIPSRRKLLKNTIASLHPQVDEIFVALNGYGQIPEWAGEFPKATFVLTDNTMGDANKFMFVEGFDGYYFSCDDDLIYPAGYIKYLLAHIDHWMCVVTLAGKRYNNLPINNWRTDITTRGHCLKSVEWLTQVHVGGTGVMAFHTDDFRPDYKQMLKRNMADIWIAKQAKEQGVDIVALPHSTDYLTYQKPDGKTIWERNDDEQYITDLINSFLK